MNTNDPGHTHDAPMGERSAQAIADPGEHTHDAPMGERVDDAVLNLLTLGLYGWYQGRKLVRPYK